MCGLAGHIGLNDNRARFYLTLDLAMGIDNRGGDAAGYFSLSRKGYRHGRIAKTWKAAGRDFFQGAASGSQFCLMHSRYATCGSREKDEAAHPFEIKRDGLPVVWGAHNGMITNARESAKENDREPSLVDSQEIFELIADKDFDGIAKLRGYGVVTWVESSDVSRIKVCRLSKDSDFEVCSLETGGLAWASTTHILNSALKRAGLKSKDTYELEIGRIYDLTKDGILDAGVTGLEIKSMYEYSSYETKGGWADWENEGFSGYGELADTARDFKPRMNRWEDKYQTPDTIDAEAAYWQEICEQPGEHDAMTVTAYLEYLARKDRYYEREAMKENRIYEVWRKNRHR
jgi:predicted glutamine amidotransferase